MKILYFTSTGNCLYVAKRISEKFKECELISISRAVKENNFKFDDDIIDIIYPIHYAGVPIQVYDFLSKVKINEKSYIFAVGVSGGGSEYNSFYQVSKLLKRKIDNNLTVKYISNYTHW